jgi:hypothetical protein
VRFVDFEWGCFRDVVLDAAYFRVPFPACEASFALPPGLAASMLDAWRAEIVGVWPDLDESERLQRRLLDAQLLWVWLCTWWLLPRLPDDASGGRDGPIGHDAARSPRISTALSHYWRELAEAATGSGRGATAELARAVVAALRTRFPDAPQTLAVYPALRSIA